MMMGQTRIGALLHDDHIATLRTLQDLENFLSGQTARKVPDVEDRLVRRVLDSFLSTVSAEVSRHFGFEEEHLFPLLAERGEGGIGEFLKQEHDIILPLANEMSDLVRTAYDNGGFTDEDWRRFHQGALELVERETFHIQKEEMGLIAAISMLVDPEADGELAMRYAEMQEG